MLTAIKGRLLAAGLALPETWEDEINTWGQQVALFREYVEGNHRAKLTQEMRDMLRISGSELDQFNLNYCTLVVEKMSDRLTVASVEADTEAGSDWSTEVLNDNRFDGMQMDVHDAALRDGITFVTVAADLVTGAPMFAHELCWDGDTGMIPVYDRMGKKLVAAVKVWYETDDERRVNIYFGDHVEKYTEGENAITPFEDGKTQPWIDRDGNPVTGSVPWIDSAGKALGVPVIPFVNRAKARLSTGISELVNIIPIQDVINRTLCSLVATEELSAFQIKVAVGFPPPAKVAPGMIIKIGEEGLSKDQQVSMFTLEQAQLVPFISMLQYLVDQIGAISQTPLPGQMGADAESGEALKQRESGLVGKCKRFQVKCGNAWEDVLKMAEVVQNAFSKTSAPQVKRWNCRWQSSEVRNDNDVVNNVKQVREIIGDEQALREIAPVFKWDETQIQKILTQKLQSTARSLALMSGGSLDNFDNFTVPVQ